MSVAALEAKVAHLRAENGRLRRALGDVCGQIVCGQLTGKLPDNFLEQFNQLPDRPFEQVLRFLPARQVLTMRHVSRKFNQLIRKCSKTMPKIKRDGTVVFRRNYYGGLIGVWFDNYGEKITTTQTTAWGGDEVAAISELLRFIRIDSKIFFSEGLSAADEVLDQLSKAWLTIRPEVVIFSGDLSQTSRDSLRAFLVKVEPSIRRLHFQEAKNIPDNLLSDELISAAGRLDRLMVLPTCWGWQPDDNVVSDINIGDNTLLLMVDADLKRSYCCLTGCSGITPGGIRAFIEKWMKKQKSEPDAKSFGFNRSSKSYELTFFKCANVTPATVEEACGDLLEKDTIAEAVRSFEGDAKTIEQVRYTIQCPSSNNRLKILFHYSPFDSHFIKEPDLEDEMVDDEYDNYDEY